MFFFLSLEYPIIMTYANINLQTIQFIVIILFVECRYYVEVGQSI